MVDKRFIFNEYTYMEIRVKKYRSVLVFNIFGSNLDCRAPVSDKPLYMPGFRFFGEPPACLSLLVLRSPQKL